MKKILNILLLAMALPTALSAQEKMRHQLRWGWGDMLFETMAFHPSPAHSYPVSVTLGDPSRTYFWDYISERQAEDDFATLYLYYYNLVYMYEDYGFMAGLCKKGTDSFDLSQDANIVPGVKYYLVISAYEEGEISSDLTFYNFVYYPEGCVMEED